MIEQDGPARETLLAALRGDGEAVAARLLAVSAERYGTGCYEGGWTAREVLAHVASIEWTYARLFDLVGDERGSGSGGGGRSASMDDYNRRQVAKRAGASVEELVEEWRRNRERTVAAVESANEALLRRPVRSFGGIEGSLGRVLWDVAIEHVRGHVADITGDPDE